MLISAEYLMRFQNFFKNFMIWDKGSPGRWEPVGNRRTRRIITFFLHKKKLNI